MTISQVQAVTVRRDMSRSLGLASQGEALHTPNANTDRGRLHQGAEKIKRRKERGTETDIKRATETMTETEGGTEIEKETGTEEEKGMRDTEKEEVTGIEERTGTEEEKMTETEAGGIQRRKTGTGRGRGRGAPKKKSGIKMGKRRRGIQMKTSRGTNTQKKIVREGRNLRRKSQ